MDLVCGNIGMNTKFSASQDHPLVIHYGDLDGNGTGDIVLAKDRNGRPVPLRGRECSSQQMPFIKEKFPTYTEFAGASLPEIYGEEQLQASLRLEAREFRTSVFINNGPAGFEQRPLPVQTRFSATNGIVVRDMDADGSLDIVLAGNKYHTEVEIPRYDAGIGCFLKGDGAGNFTCVPLEHCGFFAPGDEKDMRPIRLMWSGEPCEAVVLSNNGGLVQLFSANPVPHDRRRAL